MVWKEVLTVVGVIVLMAETGFIHPFRLDDVGFDGATECLDVIMLCEFLFPESYFYRTSCFRQCHPGMWPFLSNYHHRYSPRALHSVVDKTRRTDDTDVEEKYPNVTKDGRKIYEGDMVLSEQRAKKLYSKGRKARDDEEYFWPSGIVPYVILPSSLPDRSAILQAINHWMTHTCLVFQEVPLTSNFPRLIFEKSDGCYSSVGREKYPEGVKGQAVSIGEGCEGVGTIIHEIGHSIGFFHEHARPDRDRMVMILYQNIKKGFLGNFQIASINSRGVPYDLNSVMHYKPKEFSQNGKNTIVPLDPMRYFEIGQRKELSFLDKKLANIIYRCDAHCRPIKCMNEGYVDKNCVCKCPKRFRGDRCQISLPPPAPTCGGIITKPQEIVSPNFHNVIDDDDVKCIWKIMAPPDLSIRVSFREFDIIVNRQCKKESLEIRKGRNYDGDFYCGNQLQGKTINSVESPLYLFLTMLSKEHRGFRATVGGCYFHATLVMILIATCLFVMSMGVYIPLFQTQYAKQQSAVFSFLLCEQIRDQCRMMCDVFRAKDKCFHACFTQNPKIECGRPGLQNLPLIHKRRSDLAFIPRTPPLTKTLHPPFTHFTPKTNNAHSMENTFFRKGPRIIKREHEKNNPLKTDDGITLWEGDMILNDDQVEQMWGIGRKAESRQDYLWPNGMIPFSIDESSKNERRVIMAAINHWMAHTCLKFYEVPIYTPGPHIIFKKNTGCSSSVGRQSKLFSNGQPISVGEGCEEMGLIAHEIGHAIGFYHEHSRSDRNSLVKVLEENIKSPLNKNFNLARYINSYNIPYDLHSIMHYTSKAFTSNGRNTIVTKDPLKQLAIGQRNKLSYYDILLANSMYCANKQPQCDVECLNEGIVDASCNCVCPPEFEGEECERTVIPKCGGNITKETTIVTPNYPNKYPAETRCIWWITAPTGKRIKVKFIDFDLMSRAEQNNVCEWDNIEIRGFNHYEGEFFCGDEQKGRSVVSHQNEMIIFFATEYNSNRGFKAQIIFEEQPESEYIF